MGRVEKINYRSLHCAGAAGGKQDNLLARSEERLEELTGRIQDRAEFRSAMMNERARQFE